MTQNSRLSKKSIEKDTLRLRVLLNQTTTPSGVTDHGALSGLADDDHSQYVHISAGRTITAQHQFAPSSAQPPFTLGANAQGQLVTGLYADQLSKSVIAGNGMSGGGALTADRTITLGTPTSVSVSSGNSVTTSSHTHAVTSSSNPGAAASLLATDSAGDIILDNCPSRKFWSRGCGLIQ